MKRIEAFYKGSGDWVEAYEKADLAEIQQKLSEAKSIWHKEWEAQGSRDDGTCCTGKGIQIWHRAPRKRSAEPLTVVISPPCQGNLASSRSVEPALHHLRFSGIECSYYDGWMD